MGYKADSAKIADFQRIIIHYWETAGRKSLPWRLTNDPWKLLIAEILLRKTTAPQAVEVYEKLSSVFPEKLAEMEVSILEEMLRPIGLYRVRAHQLQQVALVVAQEGPEALSSHTFLMSLPGVGRYIRNTVLCFAFGIPGSALDTNMIRVIERVFTIKSSRSRSREDPELWRFADTLVPRENCREFNWGILDLAALICTARKPDCAYCPLNNICDYGQSILLDSARPLDE